MIKKILIVSMFSLALLSGCKKQETVPSVTPEEMPAATESNTVMIDHFVFEPSELTVPVNTTVTWKHDDSVAHTVVSGNLFESDTLNRGDNFSFDFTSPGVYDYHCSIHPSMKGKIIVK